MTHDTEPTFDVRNLALTLDGPAGPVNILREVSFSAAAGETIGLVGPSGSGKTTLLMVLAGLEVASSGDVSVVGRDFTRLDEDARALVRRSEIGIVFQSFHLIPTMSALENVAVPLELAGLPDAFDRAVTHLDAVGLAHRLDHRPGQLSGGERQRVALARAFAIEPRLLLADEPTGNLDQATGSGVIELMFDLNRERGSTLLLITHDPALAARCGRTVSIADGTLTSDVPSGDAGRTYTV